MFTVIVIIKVCVTNFQSNRSYSVMTVKKASLTLKLNLSWITVN